MSNRYGNNSHDGNKGFPKTQQKFVPKSKSTPTPTPNWKSKEPLPNPTLSNSLRQSLSRQPDVAATSSSGDTTIPRASAVLVGQNGDLVSSKVNAGNFVNYLPQDEAVAAGLGADKGGLDPVESQRVVDHLNRELSRLLKLSPRDFWREVSSDSSLHEFLESFLQFRSRSSNRDPGAGAADTLSPRDHEVLMQEKKLLDMPKLFDICAIFGHENEGLTRSLVVNALKAQPRIHDNLTAALSHFLSIFNTMHQRCNVSLEVLFDSHGGEERGSNQLHADYLEVMDFINDAIVSMDAFVNAYKPAAVFFSCPVEISYVNEDLLSTLVRLHDSLLPSLQRGFGIIFAAGENGLQGTSGDMLSDITLSLKMLSMRVVNFGWKLLDVSYLSDEVFEDKFPLPAVTKMFPANVEDPVIRADILIQTFREISGGYSHIQEGQTRRTFLQNVEKNHKIMDRCEFLQSTGWVSIDDEQFQYLNGIMKHPLEFNAKETPRVSNSLTASNKLHVDEDTAIVESKISQIKDLFPDYGKGFLSACLEVYNQNPEEVIQRILEGTLHDDLQSLDTSLENMPPCKSATLSRNDKGKGKLLESMPPPPINGVPRVRQQQADGLDKGKGKLLDAMPPPSTAVVPEIRLQQAEGPSVSASSSVGRFVRKSTLTSPDSDILDFKDGKDLAKTAALITQLEYEDEYDDSFDDLGLSVADSGVEETEILSEKLNSNRGKSWETVTGSPSNSSKWNSRKTPQFYVKDGKNYSYKVAGSVAVANLNEATLVNQSQKELIHGLGRGGNLPLGAVQRLMEQNEEQEGEADAPEAGGRGIPGNFRGGGRRGGGRNHYRKDRAMKKHFTGLSGT